MSRSRSSMEEAGGSTEPGAPSAVAAAAGAASNVVASAPTTKSRRAYHLVPDPAIYPPGAFHAPNIIDAPARRKRKDVEDYHMHVSKLRSAAAAAIALPRARQPPERLVITAKGPQLKRTRLDDVAPTPLVLVESSSSSSSVGEAKDDAESRSRRVGSRRCTTDVVTCARSLFLEGERRRPHQQQQQSRRHRPIEIEIECKCEGEGEIIFRIHVGVHIGVGVGVGICCREEVVRRYHRRRRLHWRIIILAASQAPGATKASEITPTSVSGDSNSDDVESSNERGAFPCHADSHRRQQRQQ